MLTFVNTPKHTPGPWIADDNDIRTEAGNLIGSAHRYKMPGKANAKLIAAAPAMAEALRSAANLLDQSPAIGVRVSAESAELALSIIRAALAKAGL